MVYLKQQVSPSMISCRNIHAHYPSSDNPGRGNGPADLSQITPLVWLIMENLLSPRHHHPGMWPVCPEKGISLDMHHVSCIACVGSNSVTEKISQPATMSAHPGKAKRQQYRLV